MDFEVIISPNAQEKFDQYILYLLIEKRSSQAARNILNDFEKTKHILSRTAKALKFCEDEDLRQRGYRRINFQSHRYLMLYRIVDNQVIVDDIFHELQDFKGWMK